MAYRNVHEKFWTDPKVKQLNPDEKLFFLYLITNPHTHVAGIYNLPVSYAERETGLSHKAVMAAICKLQKLEIILYDPIVEIVWVKRMFGYQGFGIKIRQSVEKQLQALHQSHLIPLFCKTYSYPMPYPIDRVSDTLPISVPDPVLVSKEKESEEKPSGRIAIKSFNESISPDDYCIQYADNHGLNGKAQALWCRMLNWHMKEGKGTKDLHATWRTWVDKAPEYNKDLYQKQQRSLEEIAKEKGYL